MICHAIVCGVKHDAPKPVKTATSSAHYRHAKRVEHVGRMSHTFFCTTGSGTAECAGVAGNNEHHNRAKRWSECREPSECNKDLTRGVACLTHAVQLQGGHAAGLINPKVD